MPLRLLYRCALSIPALIAMAAISIGPAPAEATGAADERLVLSGTSGERTNLERRAKATLQSARVEAEAGRPQPAELMLHALLDEIPDHAAALDLLDQIAAGRQLPRTSTVTELTESQLLPSFRPFESGHFIILSDVDSETVRRHSIRLERTRHQFRRFALRLGVRERPLRHRLVAVLFADRDDYRSFAHRHDGMRDTWVAGYYAPSSDRIVFYDIHSNPSLLEARRRLSGLKKDLQQRERLHPDDRNLAATRTHIASEEARIAEFAESTSTATAVHEAAHQLAFHTRVQVPWVQYPIWISEGLATSFETDDIDLPFGPDRDFEPRRRRFHALLESGDLLPLRDLIRMLDAGPHATDDLVDRIYHQSYALFTWLYRSRRPSLAGFMHALRIEPPGAVSPDRAEELFVQAFGPIDRLERSWLRVMRSDAAR